MSIVKYAHLPSSGEVKAKFCTWVSVHAYNGGWVHCTSKDEPFDPTLQSCQEAWDDSPPTDQVANYIIKMSEVSGMDLSPT